jgi:hypothetical protein
VSTPGRMTKPRPVHGLSGRPLPYGGRPSPYGSSGRGGGRSPYY